MNDYQKELQSLRLDDEIQGIEKLTGLEYEFISTASHGYLVVPKTDKFADVAKKIVDYGYTGKLAYYLEEDCEAGLFVNQVKNEQVKAEKLKQL